MPLSEEELKLLEQMERALVEEDPKLAHTLRGTSFRRSARKRAIAAGFAFALGITVLMAGAVTQLWYVGIVGFVLMLASASIALGAIHGRNAPTGDPRSTGHPSGFTVIDGGGRGSKGRTRGRTRTSRPFMERMDERWRRRREGGGY